MGFICTEHPTPDEYCYPNGARAGARPVGVTRNGPRVHPEPGVWEARPSPGRSLVRYGVVGGTSIVWIIRIALSRPPSYSHITALPIASAISFCYAPTPWTPAIRRSVEQP